MEIVTQEIWKPIPGFEDYAVSDMGNVLSLRYGGSGRLLKPTTVGQYLRVGFSVRGKSTSKLIHRLVMLAFIGPAPAGMEIRHLDGNPGNNQLKNLRYGTKKENMADRTLHGTCFMANKTQCKRGHLFNEENTRVYKTKSGGFGRECRACSNWRKREARR